MFLVALQSLILLLVIEPSVIDNNMKQIIYGEKLMAVPQTVTCQSARSEV